MTIKTRNLSKDYKKIKALNKVSLDIKKGEIFGILGPNGAGKSTTIRLLMNFIQPTDGHAIIKNKNVVSDSVEIKRDIGYLAGIYIAARVTFTQAEGSYCRRAVSHLTIL